MIRTAAGLARAARDLEAVASGVVFPEGAQKVDVTHGTAEWETTNLHTVATALAQVAALREETRGGHYREDFPSQDDSWRGRLVSRLAPDGELITRYQPLEG